MRRLLVYITLALTLAVVPAASAHKLSYRDARKAAQTEVDRFAGQRASIESLFRTSRHRYTARAEWEKVDPTGCKGCGYDPVTDTFYDTASTSYCSATLIVRYRTHRSRRPIATVDEHSCF